MAALKQQLKKFDEEFRAKYLLFLEELQAKKPKRVSLEFETDPWNDSPEQIHYLNSRGIKQHGEKKYSTLRHFVYDYGMSLEGLQKTLKGLQAEIERHNIKVDWDKVLSTPELIDQKTMKKLTSDVKKYFERNAYAGFTRGFELLKIEKSSLNPNVLHAVPRSIESEDIGPKIDWRWEEGLANIGEKYGVTIRLPPSLYTK